MRAWTKKNDQSKIQITFFEGEYRVRDLKNKKADYFTNSIEDAMQTANLMIG